jgi:hypothetical protein
MKKNIKNAFLIAFLIPFFSQTKHSYTILNSWTENPNHPTYTIYYPGVLGAYSIAARYTGNWGFTSPDTGQWIVSLENGAEIIQNIFVGTKTPEINLVSHKTRWNLWFKLQEKIAQHQLNSRLGTISIFPSTIKQTDKSLYGHSVQITKISGGQDQDIAVHHQKMSLFNNDIVQQLEKEPYVVLFGDSKGAATTFNAYATHHNNPLYKNVKLVVLEGCFDTVKNVVKHHKITKALALPKKLQNLVYQVGIKITEHKEHGPTPLTLVDKFPHDTPVVFITSLKDGIVSHKCTKNLAYTLAYKYGHPMVYLIKLKHSDHVKYPFENPDDRHTYLTSLHALYKKFGLAYIPEYADQLTNEDVDELNLSLQIKKRITNE